MSPTIRLRRTAPYAVPLAAGLAVFGIAVLPRAASGGNPHPALPARTPAQLLADVSHADVAHFSGTVVLTTRLGLPDLSFAGGSADLTSLLSGSHTAQISYGGPEQQRVAVLDSLVETEIVHNGRDVWVYDSRSNTATRHRLPADHDETHSAMPSPAGSFDPARVAADLLDAIDPTTSVTVDRTARIAGRAAYQLVLAPKQHGSLIRSVRIGIDAARHVPLRVQVFGAGTSPAVDLGFVDVSFKAPPASTFSFVAPPGRHARQDPRIKPQFGGDGVRRLPIDAFGPHPYSAPPKVVGDGWTAVAELSIGALPPGTADILHRIGTRVGNDLLLRTKLLTALVKPDGRVLVGAVTPEVLEAAAK
jgi:outer membrane lipoprotein-sorting protein